MHATSSAAVDPRPVTRALTLLLLGSVGSVAAQYANPEFASEEDIDPRVTEVYVDVPAVAPGATPAAAPADAEVLFDGSSLGGWVNLLGEAAHWRVADGAMTVVSDKPYPPGGDIRTVDSFENFQLHLEFRTPPAEGDGQGRGNSGLFLQDRYELQILDNYDNPTYGNGQLGSIYKQTPPLANPAREPGEWQTYDVIYTAPVFSASGTLIHPAYVTALLNGVLVQNHTAIQGPTPYRGRGVYEPHGPAPIRLQDHGNPMSFRNIWVRRL